MRSHILRTLIGGLVLVLIVSACGPTATFPPTQAGPVATRGPSSPIETSVPAATPTSAPVISQLPLAGSPVIQGLDMLDESNGWAWNDHGIMRTADGGATWYTATPAGMTAAPGASFFLNDMTAWVVAGSPSDPTSGTLYRTTDGGASWTSNSAPFNGGSLQFLDPNTGWDMIGLGAGMSHMAVAVFRTDDGGATWSQVFIDDPTAPNTSDTLPFAGDKSGLTALDGERAWVTGAEPVSDFIYIYSTQDGGKTWSGQNPPLPAGLAGSMTGANPPHFFNATEGVLPVGVYGNTSSILLYVTQDAGKTWTATQPVALNGRASTPSADAFFAWDGGTTLYASHDSGASWTKVETNVNLTNSLSTFQFVDAATGWAVTSDANSHFSLYKTIDGGATWKALIP